MAQPVTNLLINGLNPSSVGGTGTTIKYFPFQPGVSIGVASSKAPSGAGVLFAPGNGEANGQRMSIRASGNLTISGDTSSPNITLGLYPVTYVGTVGTIGATAILSQTLTASGTTEPFAVLPWALSADIVADGLVAQPFQAGGPFGNGGSGIAMLVAGFSQIDVTASGQVSGIVIAGLSNVNMNAAIPFGLCVGITFSQSSAANAANMYQFDLSL